MCSDDCLQGSPYSSPTLPPESLLPLSIFLAIGMRLPCSSMYPDVHPPRSSPEPPAPSLPEPPHPLSDRERHMSLRGCSCSSMYPDVHPPRSSAEPPAPSLAEPPHPLSDREHNMSLRG